jgi:hypothetical protein
MEVQNMKRIRAKQYRIQILLIVLFCCLGLGCFASDSKEENDESAKDGGPGADGRSDEDTKKNKDASLDIGTNRVAEGNDAKTGDAGSETSAGSNSDGNDHISGDAEQNTGGISESDASLSNPNCKPNPENDPLCPEICEETCNGKDDDCDSEIDEDEADTDCVFRMHASSYCSMGRCIIDECIGEYADCDGDALNGCEASLNSVTNCGACDRNCESFDHVRNAYCAGGKCTALECEAGFADCDNDIETGCETSVNSITDCALCGETCNYANAVTSCESGSCEFLQCRSGFGNCNDDLGDGCETVLNTVFNCGECNDRCGSGETCAGGVCTEAICEMGTGDCDGDPENGCETPLNTANDCRFCSVLCFSSSGEDVSCELGACTITECIEGSYDCDRDPVNGCESRLKDNLNCGKCGDECSIDNAFVSCATGNCEFIRCKPPFEDCDDNLDNGCEVETGTYSNCSACGDTCGIGFSCIEGQCQDGCDPEGCPDCPPTYAPCCRTDQTCGCYLIIEQSINCV